ncbi:MAG: hypothetical protein K5653_08800 [Clostridiales bacterium]|nr:hypothetical protein [Clostridiales bacterium]
MADNKDKIVTSEDLREELNEERKARDEYEMPAVNPGPGGGIGFSTLSRRDKSFNSVGDFFVKLAKRKKQRVKK